MEVFYLMAAKWKGWNAGDKVRPETAFFPVVTWINPTSAFWRQGQSGTTGHGLVRHCPAFFQQYPRGGIFSPFMQMYLTWGPQPEPLGDLSFCVRVFNLRSCHLRLTLGRTSLCIHILGTKRRSQVRPPSSIFEQYDPWTSSTSGWIWVWCAVILMKFQPLASGCPPLFSLILLHVRITTQITDYY